MNGKAVACKYDLLCNICHDGKAGEGSYRIHVHRKVGVPACQSLPGVEIGPPSAINAEAECKCLHRSGELGAICTQLMATCKLICQGKANAASGGFPL